jgi:DNA processing protein
LSKLAHNDLVNLKLLFSIDGFGANKFRNLLIHFKTLNNIFLADVNALTEVEGISKAMAKKIIESRKDFQMMERILEEETVRIERLQGKIITIWDDEYPPLLKNIYDPPIIIYTLGQFEEVDNSSIAVVGTRMITNYGRVQTERITTGLVEQGVTIVSGMARGVDSIAHETTLKRGGRTIAVIGSGLDVIYPAENRKLFERIREQGVVITEFEFGTQPDAQNFPKRNRIISGLSLGVVVIETATKGGAMQTAHMALDQNREVFAVPGNLGIKQSEGTNKLIQKGEAKLVMKAEDVLNELEIKLVPVLGKNIPKQQEELSLFESKIVALLANEPYHIDKIAMEAEISASDCMVSLLSLEFKGIVKQLPGKMFALL